MPAAAVLRRARDVHGAHVVDAAVAHVGAVHEDERAQVLDTAVAVVVGVDRGVPLVVGAHGAQRQGAGGGDDVGEGGGGELGAAGRGVEDEFAGGLLDAEAEGEAHAAVEVLEAGEGLGHGVPDAVVVLDVPLPGRGAVGQRGAGDAGDDRRFGEQVRRGGPLHADRQVDHAHRVLDGRALDASTLMILLGAAEARQDEGLAAVDEMAAVQLGAHLRREIAVAQRRAGEGGVGRGEGEVAAHGDEHLHRAVAHRLDGADGVQAVFAGRFDPADCGEPVQEGAGGAVVDAAGAVALHIAVSAYGTGARALAPQVAAEQQQVDDLPDGVDAVLVLADAQAPADDGAVGLAVDAGRAQDVGAAQPGLALDLLPRRGLAQRAVLVEAGGVAVDELPVQGPGVGRGLFQDRLGHAAQQCHVAADAHLEVEGAGRGRLEEGHVREVVRHDGAGGRRLDERVDVHDPGAAAVRLGERGEHPGRVGGGVDAQDEQRVGGLPVREVHGPLAGAQGRLEGTAAGLVAHVGAVRQVVRAQLTGHQLVEERGLVAEPSRGVERRLVRAVQTAQRTADQLERVLPADRDVVVRIGVVDHRLGQPALVLQVVVAPAGQLGHRVRGEELAPDPLAGHLPGDVLDPVLTDVQVQALGVVGPRASGAVEPAVLMVHPHDRPRPVHQRALAHQEPAHALGGAPARGRVVIRAELRPPLGRGPRPRPCRRFRSGLTGLLLVGVGAQDSRPFHVHHAAIRRKTALSGRLCRLIRARHSRAGAVRSRARPAGAECRVHQVGRYSMCSRAGTCRRVRARDHGPGVNSTQKCPAPGWRCRNDGAWSTRPRSAVPCSRKAVELPTTKRVWAAMSKPR